MPEIPPANRHYVVTHMLTIDQAAFDAVLAHARRDHPDEACGILARSATGAVRVIEMLNAARSPTFYEMDSLEVLRVMRALEDADDELYAIYHSHTATEAYPSRTDISIAGYPEAHYILVSTRSPDEAEFRSFRIVDGVVEEEPVSLRG